MIKKKTVLVVGAGGSAPYGYPVGSVLRKRIFSLSEYGRFSFVREAGLIQASSYPYARDEPLIAFINAFQGSQTESIDTFLAHRPEFADIGKRVIAALLLESEIRENLIEREPAEDHWYQYLLRHIAEEYWADINLGNLTVVTFNYDRSLEHYLLRVFMDRYGKSRKETIDKLRQLRIIHAYGSLGAPFPETATGIDEFGAGVTSERVDHAAQFIRVIPEGRNEDPTLIEARNFLCEADRVAFLGFGFDRTNLIRLNSTITCALYVIRSGSKVQRSISATCYGMTIAETESAFRSTAGSYAGFRADISTNFIREKCLQMLRETLILDDG